MAVLVWDVPNNRTYETGIDKGVLYLFDGEGIPWNGLTSVVEKFNRDTSPVFYDGMKISELVSLGYFSATMEALTYPDEFLTYEGYDAIRHGAFLSDQISKTFGLCYRTLVGDAGNSNKGYKIHILYNVTAVPTDVTYKSIGTDVTTAVFQWDIVAIPQEVPGFAPTAHIILDSTKLDPWLLEDLEAKLYGSTTSDAALIPMDDLIQIMNDWYRIKIIDNGDGTWTAISERDESIFIDDVIQYFEIYQANAVFLDSVTFLISDTKGIEDVPIISIVDHNDGSWSAVTDHNELIVQVDPITYQINHAHIFIVDPYTYRITDTTGLE